VIVRLVGTAPTSVAVISYQDELVTAVPLPTCEKNLLVVLVLPPKRNASPPVLAMMISPTVVIGFTNPPNPARVYSGMFSVAPTKVAAPLLPVVDKVIGSCFPKNVTQSLPLKYPFTPLEARVMDKVFVPLLYDSGALAVIDVKKLGV
jgi:hypothetical protein